MQNILVLLFIALRPFDTSQNDFFFVFGAWGLREQGVSGKRKQSEFEQSEQGVLEEDSDEAYSDDDDDDTQALVSITAANKTVSDHSFRSPAQYLAPYLGIQK